MGDAKSRDKSQVQESKQPDRLVKAIVKKVDEVTVEDRKLHIRKWNLHTSLELMGTLGDILKEVLSGVGPKVDVASLLQQDIGQLLASHEGSIVKILVGSILPGNFTEIADAEEWVKELGAGDALRLFAIIAKQNIRPLVRAVGEIAKEVGLKVNASPRKASPQQT